MSENTEYNLLEDTTFQRTVNCKLPGSGCDASRPFSFKARFKPMPQDDWEDLIEDTRKSEALREVLAEVEGIPEGKLKDGTVLSPVEVCIKNPFTCDAAFTCYALYITENGRDATATAVERKNSKRSRKR